jgi:hypothetical protein
VYSVTDLEKQPSLMELKAGVKQSLISLFSAQLIFQVFAILYIQLISYIQSAFNLDFLSPRGLSNFAWDMWLMMILLTFSLIGYSVLKKAKDFPLFLLVVYPAALSILSMVRDVSIIQVIVLSLLSCAVVLQVNYKRVKQLEFSEA